MSEQLRRERTWSATAANFIVWLASWEFKLWLLSLCLVGAGIYVTAREELSILSWKKTQGTVLEAGSVWLEPTKWGDSHLTVKIRYRYVVEGQAYESDRYTTGDPPLFTQIHEAAALRKSFPPGTLITVLYAPYAPARATLIAERGNSRWILFGFGVPCLVVVYFARRERLREGAKLQPDLDITPLIHF